MNPNPSLRFRPARPSDAEVCTSLIFASGEREMRFWLGESDEQCKAFLGHMFATKQTLFSWRRHYVACSPDGTVLSGMAAYHHCEGRFDVPHIVWRVVRFFGLRKAVSILSRGTVLDREQPPPQHGQTLLYQFATDECARGTGVFTAMLTHAVVNGWLRCAPDDQYVLDVRLGNPRARDLYERLGFVEQPRLSPPSDDLPVELVSMRMAWSAQGIAALRTRAVSVPAQGQPSTTVSDQAGCMPQASGQADN